MTRPYGRRTARIWRSSRRAEATSQVPRGRPLPRTRAPAGQQQPETRGPSVSWCESYGVDRGARLAKCPERRADLGGEELRLLPRGEMAASVHLVEVREVGIGHLDPAARGSPDLVGE